MYGRHRWRVEGIHADAKTQHGLRRALRPGSDDVHCLFPYGRARYGSGKILCTMKADAPDGSSGTPSVEQLRECARDLDIQLRRLQTESYRLRCVCIEARTRAHEMKLAIPRRTPRNAVPDNTRGRAN